MSAPLFFLLPANHYLIPDLLVFSSHQRSMEMPEKKDLLYHTQIHSYPFLSLKCSCPYQEKLIHSKTGLYNLPAELQDMSKEKT